MHQKNEKVMHQRLKIFIMNSQEPVAQACNPSYSGSRDQEHHHLKPRQKVLKTLSLKYPTYKKRAVRVAQMVSCLPSKHESLNSNPSTAPNPALKRYLQSIGLTKDCDLSLEFLTPLCKKKKKKTTWMKVARACPSGQ
jgi:hypothetical protein